MASSSSSLSPSTSYVRQTPQVPSDQVYGFALRTAIGSGGLDVISIFKSLIPKEIRGIDKQADPFLESLIDSIDKLIISWKRDTAFNPEALNQTIQKLDQLSVHTNPERLLYPQIMTEQPTTSTGELEAKEQQNILETQFKVKETSRHLIDTQVQPMLICLNRHKNESIAEKPDASSTLEQLGSLKKALDEIAHEQRSTINKVIHLVKNVITSHWDQFFHGANDTQKIEAQPHPLMKLLGVIGRCRSDRFMFMSDKKKAITNALRELDTTSPYFRGIHSFVISHINEPHNSTEELHHLVTQFIRVRANIKLEDIIELEALCRKLLGAAQGKLSNCPDEGADSTLVMEWAWQVVKNPQAIQDIPLKQLADEVHVKLIAQKHLENNVYALLQEAQRVNYPETPEKNAPHQDVVMWGTKMLQEPFQLAKDYPTLSLLIDLSKEEHRLPMIVNLLNKFISQFKKRQLGKLEMESRHKLDTLARKHDIALKAQIEEINSSYNVSYLLGGDSKAKLIKKAKAQTQEAYEQEKITLLKETEKQQKFIDNNQFWEGFNAKSFAKKGCKPPEGLFSHPLEADELLWMAVAHQQQREECERLSIEVNQASQKNVNTIMDALDHAVDYLKAFDALLEVSLEAEKKIHASAKDWAESQSKAVKKSLKQDPQKKFSREYKHTQSLLNSGASIQAVHHLIGLADCYNSTDKLWENCHDFKEHFDTYMEAEAQKEKLHQYVMEWLDFVKVKMFEFSDDAFEQKKVEEAFEKAQKYLRKGEYIAAVQHIQVFVRESDFGREIWKEVPSPLVDLEKGFKGFMEAPIPPKPPKVKEEVLETLDLPPDTTWDPKHMNDAIKHEKEKVVDGALGLISFEYVTWSLGIKGEDHNQLYQRFVAAFNAICEIQIFRGELAHAKTLVNVLKPEYEAALGEDDRNVQIDTCFQDFETAIGHESVQKQYEALKVISDEIRLDEDNPTLKGVKESLTKILKKKPTATTMEAALGALLNRGSLDKESSEDRKLLDIVEQKVEETMQHPQLEDVDFHRALHKDIHQGLLGIIIYQTNSTGSRSAAWKALARGTHVVIYEFIELFVRPYADFAFNNLGTLFEETNGIQSKHLVPIKAVSGGSSTYLNVLKNAWRPALDEQNKTNGNGRSNKEILSGNKDDLPILLNARNHYKGVNPSQLTRQSAYSFADNIRLPDFCSSIRKKIDGIWYHCNYFNRDFMNYPITAVNWVVSWIPYLILHLVNAVVYTTMSAFNVMIQQGAKFYLWKTDLADKLLEKTLASLTGAGIQKPTSPIVDTLLLEQLQEVRDELKRNGIRPSESAETTSADTNNKRAISEAIQHIMELIDLNEYQSLESFEQRSAPNQAKKIAYKQIKKLLTDILVNTSKSLLQKEPMEELLFKLLKIADEGLQGGEVAMLTHKQKRALAQKLSKEEVSELTSQEIREEAERSQKEAATEIQKLVKEIQDLAINPTIDKKIDETLQTRSQLLFDYIAWIEKTLFSYSGNGDSNEKNLIHTLKHQLSQFKAEGANSDEVVCSVHEKYSVFILEMKNFQRNLDKSPSPNSPELTQLIDNHLKRPLQDLTNNLTQWMQKTQLSKELNLCLTALQKCSTEADGKTVVDKALKGCKTKEGETFLKSILSKNTLDEMKGPFAEKIHEADLAKDNALRTCNTLLHGFDNVVIRAKGQLDRIRASEMSRVMGMHSGIEGVVRKKLAEGLVQLKGLSKEFAHQAVEFKLPETLDKVRDLTSDKTVVRHFIRWGLLSYLRPELVYPDGYRV